MKNNLFKVSNWKDYHLLLLLTNFLLWSNFYQSDENFIWYNLLFLFILSVITASLGYYINDVFDIKKDQLSNKTNIASSHSITKRLVIIVSLIGSIYLVWYLFSSQFSILLILILEISSFFLYSIPFIRLKEKPIISVLIDAFYAFIAVGLITLILFKIDFELIHRFYLVWLFLIGVRGILSHHIKDFQNDLKSHTKTTVVQYGETNVKRIISYFVLPLELMFFTLFIYNINIYLFLFFIIYSFFILFKNIRCSTPPNYVRKYHDLNLISPKVDDFYLSYTPFIILVQLLLVDYLFGLLIMFFLLFFFKRAKEIGWFVRFIWNFLVDKLLKFYAFCRRWIGLIVNYALYYFCLLFGVNLKERRKKE